MLKQQTTTIEFEERTFELRRIAGQPMAAIVKRLGAALAPLLGLLETQGEQGFAHGIAQALQGLDDESIAFIYNTALRHCYEVKPAGNIRVLENDGRWGVPDVEYDFILLNFLVVSVLAFCASFFDVSRLKSARQALQATFPQGLKILAPSVQSPL